jgi:hypothetical protein
MKNKIRDKFLRFIAKARTHRMRLPAGTEDFKNYPAYGGVSVVELNSTCLEVVDARFAHKGELGFWLMIGMPTLLTGAGGFVFIFYKALDRGLLIATDFLLLFVSAIFAVLSFAIVLFFILTSRVDFTGFSVRKIRFNRKNQRVYFMDRHGQLQSYNWKDINADLTHLSLNAHMHTQLEFFRRTDHERYEPLFILGFYTEEYFTLCYWEFIRCYMEEDVIEDLVETIAYCADLADGQETFWSGFLTLVSNYMDTRVRWIWLPVMVPYTFISACLRWIGMRTGKTLVWPQDVQEACAPEANDPIRVDASHNPPNRWGYTFITVPIEYYDEHHKQVNSARERIEKKLEKKYSRQTRSRS